jgi:uncharacterized protein (DUF849 family)
LSKVILEVRCNEYAMRDKNPHVPWSAEEIATDAAECREAGAALLHFHARDAETGAPSHAVAAYAEAIRETRERTDLLVMPTLGAHTLQDPLKRVSHIVELSKDPATRPDLAPIDLASTNLDPYQSGRGFLADDVVYVNSIRGLRAQIAEVLAAGVAVHAVLWNVGSTRVLGAFLEMGELSSPLPLEVVLSDQILACHPETERGLDAILDFLPGGGALPWIALCAGSTGLPLVEAVLERGGHLSFGLGDWPYPELGQPRNAEVVDEVVRRIRAVGGEPASPAEAREILGLRSP